MVELKKKTVEELRKMASKKKIEGRSKMNKAQLVRALKKTSSGKKTMKRKKMKGGDLTDEQLTFLIKNLRLIFVSLYITVNNNRLLLAADNIYRVQGNDSVIVIELDLDFMMHQGLGLASHGQFIIIPKNLINLVINSDKNYNLNIDESYNYTRYNSKRDGELIPNEIQVTTPKVEKGSMFKLYNIRENNIFLP